MIKITNYIIVVFLALLLIPLNTNAQFNGGLGSGAKAQTYTNTTCATPPQFYAYFGGMSTASSINIANYTSCSTPPQFFAYMGGSEDGANTHQLNLTACTTPPQFFAYMGGSEDGSHLETIITTTCSTPSQFFAYMGGNDDGQSVGTLTLCSTSPPVAAFAASSTTICAGASTSFTDQSLNSPTNWNWTFAGATPSVSTLQNPNVVYNTPGVYSVTLTAVNSNGNNTVVMSNYITVNAIPVADAGNNTSICTGNSTVLNASGGTSYSWTPSIGLSSTTIQNPIANPTATTIYTVIVTNNGCSKTDAVTISVTAPPIANAGPDLNLCTGSTVSLNASGGSTYSWSPAQGLSSTTSANPVVTTTSTTTYTLYVSNGACSDADAVTVTIKPLPVIDAGTNQNICSGTSATLSAVGGSSFTWTPSGSLNFPNSISPVATPTTTTIYTLTASDGTCTAKDVVTVSVTPLPLANAGTDATVCVGSSATLTATGGTSYNWTPNTNLSSTNIANPVANPTVTTDYTVTVTNNGCSKDDVIRVNVLAAPTANAGTDKNVCLGSTTSLNASGGTSYLWSPATGLSSNTIANPIVNTTVNLTYTVTVSNGACSSTDAVNVNVLSLPLVNAGTDKVICTGDSAILNGSGGLTYTWSPTSYFDGFTFHPVIDFPNSVSPKAFPYLGGTTSYTLTASNGSCTASDVVTVTKVSPPNPNAGSDVAICQGNSITLTASGGTSYTWSPAINISNVNSINPDVNPVSTTIYTVSVSNGVCVRNDAVVVTVETTPIAFAGNDINLCYGSSATLNATGGSSYVWSPSQGLSNTGISNPIVTNTNTTAYTVTVTTAGGCTATDIMVVNAKPLPTVDAGVNQTICQGNTVVMNPTTSGTTYSWSPSFVFDFANSSNPTANPASTSNFTLTVGNGTCTANDVVTVSVTPLPNADAGADISICTGASATLTATGGTSYLWTPSTGLSNTTIANPITTPTATTNYTVTVTNNGCSATDVITVNATNSLIVDAGINQTICNGAGALLIATGGSSYTWTPSTGLSSTTGNTVNASPSVTTTYTVNAASGGCSSTDEVTVFVNPTPTVSITSNGSTAFCSGGSVGLIATSSASSYTWSNGALTPSITVNTSGNYNVTVSNGSCTANSNVIAVTVYTAAATSITPNGPTTFCNGGSVILSANTGTNYSWSTGANTQTVSVTSTGVYSVSVDDVNGCGTGTSSVAITVNPNPNAPVVTAGGATSICIGDAVTLFSDAADSYLWNTGATTASISVTTAGTYSVTNYNSFNCGTTSSGISIAVNDPLADFTGTPTLVFIPNAVTSFSANTTGFAPYTYLWEFGDGGTSASATPTHTYNLVAFNTVSLTVTDNTGCSKMLVKPDYIQVEQLFPSTGIVTGTTLDISGVSFQDPEIGLMALTDGNCGISVDSGKVFTPLPTGNTEPLTGVCALPGKWVAVGKNGTVIHSINNGANWNPIVSGTTEDFNAIHCATPTSGHIVGKNGVIHKFTGSSVSAETSSTTEHLNGIYEFNNGNALAVGDNQTILSYNGTTWSAQTSPINFNIKDVRFSDLLNGYVVGSNGNILQTTNGGASWAPSLTGVDVNFNSVDVAGNDTAWATGSGGIVYKTVDNGNNWVRYSVGYTDDQSQLRVTKGGKGHIVGNAGNARYFNDNDGNGVPTFINSKSTILNSLQLYPNPARDRFTISGYLNTVEKVTIDIKDAQAKLVKRVIDSTLSGEYYEKITTDYYSPGIYFIHIQIGKQSMVKKLVIMK
ncbi:MAG: PKD domain-containing protein [Bacteroidetes bacterium]|nr:PKD domain-containing protein [Bacteroidota bacterium]